MYSVWFLVEYTKLQFGILCDKIKAYRNSHQPKGKSE